MQNVFQIIKTLLFGSIIGPAVLFLFIAALGYFLWGVVRFIISGESPEARRTGSQHMLWGIIGLGIMLSAFGIAAFIFSSIESIGGTTGIDNKPVQTPSILQPGNQNFSN